MHDASSLEPLPDLLGAVLVVLALALLLALYRLLRGPTIADRLIAVEVATAVTLGIVAVWSVASGHAAFLDAALVLALVTFLGTVAFARYIERASVDVRAEEVGR